MQKFIPAFLIILLLLADSSFAQDREALGRRFFRVTITANEKPLLAESIFEDRSGSLIVKGAPLSMVMARAYGIEPHQLIDAPEWVHQAHLYDIEAVPPPAQLVTADETEALQALLAERFGLEVRRERREITMVVLDVDRAKQNELAREAQAHREAGRELAAPPPPPEGRPPTEAEIARANAYLRSLGYRPVTTKVLLREFSARRAPGRRSSHCHRTTGARHDRSVSNPQGLGWLRARAAW